MRIFNGEPFQVITHFATDGAGCGILLRHAFGNQVKKVYPCGYGKLHAGLKKGGGNLILSDLSLTQEQIDIVVKNFKKVIWFDHHETSLGLNYPDDWQVFINTKACATKLIYLWLTHIGYDFRHAKKFVEDVNDYDMWIHKNPSSILLNNIFWDLSFWEFSKAFDNFSWDPKTWERAKVIEHEKRDAISKMESYCIEDILRVTIGNKYISDITLFYPEIKSHLIILGNGKMSVRGYDLLKFYDELNDLDIEAGGHKEAGGVTFAGDPMVIIELFYNYLKESK